MKIKISLLILLCAKTLSTDAQDFYMKAGMCYAFAMPGQKVDQSGNVLNGTVSTHLGTTVSNIKNASFTSGMQGTVGGGLMLSKNIGIELNADIDLTPRKYTERLSGLTNGTTTYDYAAERQAKNSIILLPSLLLKSGPAKWSAYMRMGLALPFNTGITLKETYLYQSGDVNQSNWRIKNYFSLGFAAATGIRFKLNDHIALYAEASMLYLSLSRKERDLESFTINGASYPASQFSGVKTYHYSKNGVFDSNGDAQALPQPFSNLGVTGGIFISLNDHKKNNKHAK